ncbi:LptF/LptG family permease [Candidatus Pelagibacter sp. HIMB1709]|uniref:LptF/LptG family permease n=1 Tax=Candidatus Pelagibacter sp. HIMB1709 TaxID=3413367 RepID=UPI003F85A10D
MKTHIQFIIISFLKSFLNVFLVMLSLVFILNILQEIEFFSNKNVGSFYPIYLSLMNTPSIIFEMFPFIFLIAAQFFFIKLFNNDEINIFKYSGLKNIKIIYILSVLSFSMGIIAIVIFYNLSSTLQSYYLEIKNQYSADKSDYLAVINKNGLWIKDIVDDQISIINASKINNNILSETFISTFDKDYKLIKNIRSNKVDIKKNKWLIYDASIYENNTNKKIQLIEFDTNFNQKKIESLFSNLSSLSILKLFDLRKNYKSLSYSLVDVDLQINKILVYPLYLMLMTILSSIIMFNTKSFKGNSLKIVIGLFLSVIVYYISNFFSVLGVTEKIPLIIAIFSPIIILCIINSLMLININEK